MVLGAGGTRRARIAAQPSRHNKITKRSVNISLPPRSRFVIPSIEVILTMPIGLRVLIIPYSRIYAHGKVFQMSVRTEETKNTNDGTRLLAINEVAARLNLCRKSVENLVNRKELKVARIGRRVMIAEGDLERFIQKRLR